jgi:hypothetical protein
MRTVFDKVPDVPVSKFVLTMNGGKKGLLTSTRDLCAGPAASRVTLKSQNGRQVGYKHLKLRAPACEGNKK